MLRRFGRVAVFDAGGGIVSASAVAAAPEPEGGGQVTVTPSRQPNRSRSRVTMSWIRRRASWSVASTRRVIGHHDLELVAFLHQDENLAEAQRRLHELIRELIANAAQSGYLRDDIAPDELAAYCLNALNAAVGLPSHAAVRRLVQVTMTGLRRP
jgi:hypothetical protein